MNIEFDGSDVIEALTDKCPNAPFKYCECGECYNGRVLNSFGMELVEVFKLYLCREPRK